MSPRDLAHCHCVRATATAAPVLALAQHCSFTLDCIGWILILLGADFAIDEILKEAGVLKMSCQREVVRSY